MKLYSKEFINTINKELPNIQKKGNTAKVKNLEPTIDEYKQVIKIIIKFIEDKIKNYLWWEMLGSSFNR